MVVPAARGVAFYHKQGGGRTSRSGGDLLAGVRYRQYPAVFPDGRVGMYDASHIDPHPVDTTRACEPAPRAMQ